MHKTNFRQRPLDFAKPIQLIKDIKDLMKTTQYSENQELNSIDAECKKIFQLSNSKKKIITPNSQIINKKPTQTSIDKSKFDIEEASNEYIRPEHYIIYSQKSRKENHRKEYEASYIDMTFLNFENNFLTLDELENVFSAIENDIGNGEQIPPERAKEIICNLLPNKVQHIQKLIKFYFTRREDFKKSLLRKYWKEQKSTDKYIKLTFGRRDREKIKTRRNKQSERESLEQLKDIRDITNTTLKTLIKSMKLREDLKHHYIQIEHIYFQSKAFTNFGEKVTSELEKQWRKEQIELKQIEELIKQEIQPLPEHLTNSEKIVKCSPIVEGSDQQKQIKPKKRKIKNKEEENGMLKLRFRFNRARRLVVDRYIQNKHSFSPFDDSISYDIFKYKNYIGKEFHKVNGGGNFDSLYNNYLMSSLDKYNINCDSEEDSISSKSDIKSFEKSHKRFLKQKRWHN